MQDLIGGQVSVMRVRMHLCYSTRPHADSLTYFERAPGQAIDGLDADVLTIENSRSGDEMLRALAKYGYSRDIGAGVYDVHSPVVPPCAPPHT